jgi:hypothetical protein
MKVSLERKTVKRNSKAQKKRRLTTPVSSEKKNARKYRKRQQARLQGESKETTRRDFIRRGHRHKQPKYL